ncbi:Hypothetical predicted protein [Pelobates cultripes]|uniref:Uncharacterized protein n=1 Tax=Pelobates cultripes TaxID=61616 RepID=A0AAD1R850_PELCU|nr:Hypothetical predicted protein [Pelobates cultripes]
MAPRRPAAVRSAVSAEAADLLQAADSARSTEQAAGRSNRGHWMSVQLRDREAVA